MKLNLESNFVENFIVGAGPAGLAIAGRLAVAKRPFTIIEASTNIAHSWRNHYDRLHLHTDKKYSALPHYPFPKNFPTYISKNDLVAYYEAYCQHFSIKPQFNESLIKLEKEGSFWRVISNKNTYIAKNVILCTGYNRVPKIPTWQGQELFEGQIIHSQQYKNAKNWVGKNVLVVGFGNSGAEIALDICETGANTWVLIRNPVNIVKRDFLGKSTQGLSILLSQTPTWFADGVANIFKKISLGNISNTGIPISEYSPSAQLRETGKVPVIDLGTLEKIKQGKIKVLRDIVNFSKKTITFSSGETLPFDAVVLATGYRAAIENYLPKETHGFLDEQFYPKDLWSQDKGLENLYFLGYKIASAGILREININSEQILRKLIQ